MGGHPNLRKHSFKNYSSGKKGTIFFGWPPKELYFLDGTLKKQTWKNTASKIIVPEKKELYFWEGTQTWKNTASKIIVPEKKELYSWEGTQTWEKTASKIIVPEKKELYFWEGTQTYFWECPKKHSFQNYSSGKKELYFWECRKCVKKNQTWENTDFKNASKIIVPEKKELYFWEGTQTWENTASKIIVPEKKELYFWEGTQTWENTASKIIVPEKKELYFWEGTQTENTAEKTQLQKL